MTVLPGWGLIHHFGGQRPAHQQCVGTMDAGQIFLVIWRRVVEYLQITQSFETFPPWPGEHFFYAFAGIGIDNTLQDAPWSVIVNETFVIHKNS